MPVRVYQSMPVGQIIYFDVRGEVITPYNLKQNAKYNDVSPLPKESQMWRNFEPR